MYQERVVNLLAALVVCALPMVASAAPAFDDPAVQRWVEPFWSGHPEQVLIRLEEELAKPDPHPFAVQSWVQMHVMRDTLEARLAAIRGSALHARVADHAEVVLLRRAGKHAEVVERFGDLALQGQVNPWMLYDIQSSAVTAGRSELADRILLQGIARWPDLFQLVWELSFSRIRVPATRAQVEAMLSSGAIAAGSPAAGFLRDILASPEWDAVERVTTGRAWLERVPADTRAMVMVGQSLNALGRHEEAAALGDRALRLYPFFSNTDQYWQAMARAGRLDEAQATLGHFIRGFHGPGKDKEFAQRQAAEQRREGDLGSARRTVTAALARHPGDMWLNLELARIEYADERFDQALDVMEGIIGQGMERLEWWQVMLDSAQGADRASQVLTIFERMQAAGVEPDPAAYGAASWAYGALGRTGDRRTLMAGAVERFPESQWMQREFAWTLYENGEREQAVRVLVTTLDADPASAWAWIRLREWAPDRLPAAAARHPAWSFAWRELAALETTPGGKLAVWQRAIAANPQAAMGWIGAVGVLTDAANQAALGGWPSALAQAREARAALEGARPAQRLAADKLFAETVASTSRAMTLPEEVLAEASEAAERLRDAGGSLIDHHDAAKRVALAREQSVLAADHALAGAELTRDYRRFHDLVADHGRELGYRAWRFGAEALDRQPMKSSVVYDLMHKHVMWGGDSVVALQIMHEARERGVNVSAGMRNLEAQAYGDLGDGVRAFERYHHFTAISNSDRYISQFDRARSRVREERRRVNLVTDAEHPTVDIVGADGTVVRRVHERINGKVLEITQDSAWVRARYDADGQIVRIANAAGAWTEWDYTGSRITTMRTHEGATLDIAYNDEGRPVRIHLAGVGTIVVEYEAGEISRVTAESSGESDHRLALQVTQAFQGMLAQVRGLEEALRTGRLPDMPTPDPVFDRLEAAYRDAPRGSDAETRAMFAVARHMAANVARNGNYARHAKNHFERLIEQGRAEGASRVARDTVVPSITAWQDLMLATRPYGVSADDLAQWNAYQRWLNDAAMGGDRAARTALQRPVQTPESVDAPWHVRHAVGNPGYWRRFGNADLLPERARGAEKRAMLVRASGDVVVGSSSGISVYRDGHWSHFLFDPRFGTFVQASGGPAGDARSSVTALAETADGTLWIGTEDGLYALGADYGEGMQEWRTERDGLPSPRITALSAHDDEVWIGTSAGLRRWNGSEVVPSGGPLDGQGVVGLDASGDTVTARTAQGATVHHDGRWQVLSRRPVDGAVFDRREQVFLVLRENRVFAIPARTLANPAESVIPGEIRTDRAVHGLVRIVLDGMGEVPAVLTDTGIAFFRDWRMTMMEMPLREQRDGLVTGPRVAGSGRAGAWFATHEGVYGFESGRVVVEQRRGAVYDLLSDDEYGVTWIATGETLDFMPHDADVLLPHERFAGGVERMARIHATHLALAADGALITNDGSRILRLARGETRLQELFQAYHAPPERWMEGPVRSLEVARNGDIWVAAGASVFRYTPEGVLTHFSWFEDPERFPARSQMITRVVETVTGEIWAVASWESHLNWRGVSLVGGLLRFDGDRFVRVEDESLGNHWFITGYTAIDERTAIVGTTAGFVRHRDGQYARYHTMGDPSYDRLRAETPMLYLGRRGARLGEGRWLFPSAGGLVMYNNGQWLMPARLNQLLPDDVTLGQYGARTVHAVAVSPHGTIYAGTDLGLMVYRAGGAASLLIDDRMGGLAFDDHETRQLGEQRDILLGAVRGDSAAAQVVARIRDQDREIDLLDQRASAGESPTPIAMAAGERPASRSEAARLREQMQERQRERARLLARLERENFGLFQMLTLDPRELSALHRELGPDQAVLQYIPDNNVLHIQVVTRDGTQMVAVNVDRTRLDGAARRVSHHLTGMARALPDYELRAGVRSLRLAGLQISDEAQFEQDIAWLYDQLIRPARIALGERTQVFVVPVGSLYYLPFAVLKDRVTGQHAVQQYTLGVLPSMYHLSLVLRHQPSLSESALIVGDPDGTLPGARQEADVVRGIAGAGGRTLIGAQATIAAFNEQAPESRIVHIATHGVLDHEHPEASYLVMGGGQRLDVVDIQMLPLAETDLVVLSACDTGIGRSGLEVATLARAFAHARVPTVVASLWQVNDGATLALMTGFYERLRAGEDHLAALANAQRALLERGDDYAKPEAWAGFQVFGKP